MEHLGTKILETPRLLLRKFTMDDVQAVYDNWASNDEVTKYLMWPTHTNTDVTASVLQSWVDRYKNNDYYQWAIILKDSGKEPIGNIAVVSWDDRIRKAQIGYCLGQQWWYQGIMTEALNAVIDFLMNQIGMKRIEAYHDVRNIHSGAVLQKCGMVYEGTLRQSEWNNQGVCDAAWYVILAE